MPLNERSLRNLEGVHPDLVRVVKAAAEKEPFLVTEGLRNLERQRMLVKAGKSKTLNSRHLVGCAVDLCDTDGCYDVPDMKRIAAAMKSSAEELGVKIQWGGDWESFVDQPHFELDRKAYPGSGVGVVAKVSEAISKPAPVAVGAGSAGVTLPNVPAPPDLSQYTAWQSFGDTAASLLKWGAANPIITGILVIWVGIFAFGPKILEKTQWAQSSD